MSDECFRHGAAMSAGACLVIGAILMCGVQCCSVKRVRQEAVDAKCADWVVDQSTGEVHFQWVRFPPRTVIMEKP